MTYVAMMLQSCCHDADDVYDRYMLLAFRIGKWRVRVMALIYVTAGYSDTRQQWRLARQIHQGQHELTCDVE